MSQGRLPVGPNDDSSRPDPGKRIGRKIEAIRRVLQLEEEKGYSDSAVFGGVDRFFERWVEDPDIVDALKRADITLPSYAALTTTERAAWAKQALERLGETSGTPNSAPSSPPSQERTTAPAPTADEEPPTPSLGQLRRSSRGGNRRGASAAAKKPPAKRSPAPPSAPTPKSLNDPLSVPSRMAPGLKRMGIETYRDALWAFPRRYLQVVPVSELTAGQPHAIAVSVLRSTGGRYTRGRQLAMTEAVMGDATGSVTAVWFGRTWMARSLKRGARFLLIGRLTEYRGSARFNVESQEQLEQGHEVRPGDLVPVYPLTEGVTQRGMRNVVAPAAERALTLVQDYVPEHVRASARLPGLQDAFKTIHHPNDLAQEQTARRRLAFDEMLLLQLGLLERRRTRQSELGAPIPREQATLDRFLSTLPFTLTDDQKKSLDEILGDMKQSAPMMRLLQGDVGSGKTVVAAAALVTAAAHGFQGALMAPTEILAEQHFKTLTAIFGQGERESGEGGPYRGFSGILEDRPIRVALLTGSMAAGTKSQLHQLIARGDVDIAIGTHALIQEGVTFDKLGLAIVDEQHRFGVAQRASLRNKGFSPHLLVMTATPIPRTMALAVYGDLDVSTIAQMPPGRPETRTKALFPEERQRAYDFIRREVAAERQAFVICPLVEESEAVEAKAAVAEHKRLSEDIFPDLHIGLLHGRMKPQEKEEVMERFRQRDLDVLVSTAVVEVGIDIPNATVMMVEGAERFGLSQLHQYRGRVGRGTEASYCILVSDSEAPEARERLSLMESTRDGFKLAEADMQLRGPGEFFGTRQSGLPDLNVATLGDLSLIEEVRKQALALVEADPELRASENRALKEEVQRFWARASEAPEGG